MQWIRVDANLDDHPKSVEAGFWGVVVVQVIWRLTKRHGSRGHLESKYVSERHLRHVTRCDEATARLLYEGVSDAAVAGFLVLNNDGSVDVHGWDEVQWDSTHAERQRKYRKKIASRDGSDVSRDAVTDVTGTPPHPTPPQSDPSDRIPPPQIGVQEDEVPKGRLIGIIDPDSPPDGLQNPERVRRFFCRIWRDKYGSNYPQEPEKDNAQAVLLLKNHRRLKIKEPWQEWVQAAMRAYLEIDDDKLVTGDRHAMRHIGIKLQRIVASIGGQP